MDYDFGGNTFTRDADVCRETHRPTSGSVRAGGGNPRDDAVATQRLGLSVIIGVFAVRLILSKLPHSIAEPLAVASGCYGQLAAYESSVAKSGFCLQAVESPVSHRALV